MGLFLVVAIPILFSILIYIFGDESRPLRNTFVIIPSVINFLLVVSIANSVLNGGTYSITLTNAPPFVIRFNADPFSVYMGLLITFLWMLTNIYSFGYMEHEHAQTRYFSVLTLCSAATLGIIFSANLITFFIFFEFLTVAVYPLVIHEESEEAWNAGVKYGAYLLTGGVAVLLGIIIVYSLTGGNMTFTPGGIPELAGQSSSMLLILFLLFMFGFGFKAGIIPMHSWLPDAMIAPTPVSAVLHAVAVVNIGLYGFYRIIYSVFGLSLFKALNLNTILAVPAAITVLVSAVVALRQKEIKRMLAFSTVNQLSYVLLGIASLDKIGMLGGMLHIVYHSFMKITLFYCAGSIITQSGNKYIAKMGGLAKKMPITMIAFTVAAVGIIGLPPGAGWISKWYLVQGYLQQAHPIYAAVFILSGIIEVGYLMPPIFLAFFGKEETTEDTHAHHSSHSSGSSGYVKEAPWAMTVPIIIVAVVSVLFGLWAFIPHRMAEIALTGLLG